MNNIVIGMTTEEARALRLPVRRIRETRSATAVREQWCLDPPGNYLFFDAGRLTSYTLDSMVTQVASHE